MKYFQTLTLAASVANAFPFLGQPHISDKGQVSRRQQQDTASCPTSSDHTGAVPFNSKYPYTGSDPKLGNAGTGKGGIQVPAPGDTDHAFMAPGPNDIRGPCPGLNTAANHGFISRDGIVTFNELVAAQQNLYNVGYGLAVLLAVFGVELDGDVVTQKLSIGCDATSRTSSLGSALQMEPGLDGHNKFEADTSLTRDDYFLGDGDNHSFNATLFKMMSETSNNNFDRQNLGIYRAQRWNQSQADNPNFFFGVGSLLLYGAASFLYELMPGSSNSPDLPTMMSFFGASKDGDDFTFNNMEKIPDNWKNRVSPYSLMDVSNEIGGMYEVKPVPFGANTGPGTFNAFFSNGSLTFDMSNPQDVECALYQLAVGSLPADITGTALVLTNDLIGYATGKLNPIFKNTPCPNLIF